MVAHLCSRLADLVPQGICTPVTWCHSSIYYKAPVADDFVQQPSSKQINRTKSTNCKRPEVARHSTAVALEVQTLKVMPQTRTAGGRERGFGGVCYMTIVISC